MRPRTATTKCLRAEGAPRQPPHGVALALGLLSHALVSTLVEQRPGTDITQKRALTRLSMEALPILAECRLASEGSRYGLCKVAI